MSIEKIPTITTLLRASRCHDEEILQMVLERIIKNGINEEDLNATDCNGRTALSYMCSTNATPLLDVLLHTPGIDINKADTELNTPLHYAAECGQFDAIRMMLTQNKLEIDAKNIFGFTPLMKAAMQGHIRCAKTLLFAGSSTEEIDYKRRFRAEDWARFCGRHSCAEVIEKCSRNRIINLLDGNKKRSTTEDGGKHKQKPRPRANSIVTTNMDNVKSSNESGIRSKLSKVLNFVSRDRTNQSNANKTHKNASLKNTDRENIGFRSNFGLSKKDDKISLSDGFLNKSLSRPIEVPKLEVTSPHNQELIRKYEKRYSLGNTDTSQPPPLPPRRGSKHIY